VTDHDPAQNPNAPWWCWTDNEPSTFRCRELGHDVRPVRKLGDPSTREWRAAVEQSTGARLRDALEANQQLAVDHAKCVLEVERFRAERDKAIRERDSLGRRLGIRFEQEQQLRRGRDEATERALELAAELAKAREEINWLTAGIARHPTEKGLAAVQPTDNTQETQ